MSENENEVKMKVKMSENENEVKMKVKMKNSIYKSGIYKIYNERKKNKLNIIFTKSQNWIKKVSSWKKTAKSASSCFFCSSYECSLHVAQNTP
jgi:hypothetical protein